MLRTPLNSPAELAIARAEIAVELADAGLDAHHIADVEVVADELLTRAMDAGLTRVQLIVEPHDLATSVFVRCERYVDLRDEPIDLRARVVDALTVSSGTRRNVYGTTDLWAEVPR